MKLNRTGFEGNRHHCVKVCYFLTIITYLIDIVK